MKKICSLDKVTNEKVLRRVNEDRQILNSIWQMKHRWLGHVLRHDGLLHEIIEGRMKAKPTRGKRRIQMLHDLANAGGFVAFKRALLKAERDGDTEKECQKPAAQQKTILMIIIIIIIFLYYAKTAAYQYTDICR